GTVDLGRDPCVMGDYACRSAMGILWSQHPEQPGGRQVFNTDVADPLVTRLTAQAEVDDPVGEPIRAELVQRLLAPGVTRHEVREGLVGVLFEPAGPGPHPTVVVLNGS